MKITFFSTEQAISLPEPTCVFLCGENSLFSFHRFLVILYMCTYSMQNYLVNFSLQASRYLLYTIFSHFCGLVVELEHNEQLFYINSTQFNLCQRLIIFRLLVMNQRIKTPSKFSKNGLLEIFHVGHKKYVILR